MTADGNFFHAIREAKTVEDFIHAVADLGDPETGDVSEWDPQELIDVMFEIITTARRYQQPMSLDRGRLLEALAQAKEELKRADKRATALHAVSEALRR